MKIIINATGQTVDEPLNKAQRMINKGIAHIVKEEVKPIVKTVIKTVIPIVKEKVTEIDLIEPIPERFVSFKKPKKNKKRKITDENYS